MFSFWNAPEHWVYFKALMSDDCSSNRFGLRIVGYLFRDHHNDAMKKYFQVGECKPRKLKTGKISIQLRSGMFEADESVGEYPGLLQKTIIFEGNDFDVDFACVFKCKTSPKLFGKVEIKSVGCSNDNDISFNLMKSCAGSIYQISQERYLLTELVGLLRIDDKMWKELAVSLHYTRPEVEVKFSSHSEPIEEMLADFISNGGSMEEFLNAMIKVAKIFKIYPLGESNKHRNKNQEELCYTDSSEVCITNRDIGRKRKYNTFSSEPLTESKLDDIAGVISRSWKSVGRKLSLSELELREIELDYSNSGEKEKAFQMLIMWRERDPENCVPEKLFSVLNDSGLKRTALECSL